VDVYSLPELQCSNWLHNTLVVRYDGEQTNVQTFQNFSPCEDASPNPSPDQRNLETQKTSTHPSSRHDHNHSHYSSHTVVGPISHRKEITVIIENLRTPSANDYSLYRPSRPGSKDNRLGRFNKILHQTLLATHPGRDRSRSLQQLRKARVSNRSNAASKYIIEDTQFGLSRGRYAAGAWGHRRQSTSN